MSETWLPVPGYEGLYEVSDMGRVRSLDRYIQTKTGVRKFAKGTILKPRFDPCGRPFITLCGRDGKRNQPRIHRLVLAAFIGPCPEGLNGLHWDDDCTNNALENLRYGTQSENMQDCLRNGHHREAAKTHCKHGHEFTPENVIPRGTRRRCKACLRISSRNVRARQRQQQPKPNERTAAA